MTWLQMVLPFGAVATWGASNPGGPGRRRHRPLAPVIERAGRAKLTAHIAARTQRTAAGCLEYQGTRNAAGYGIVNMGGAGPVLVHRVAWALAHGEVPEGLEIHHRCETRSCCAIEHLEPTTHARNLSVASSKPKTPESRVRMRAAQQQRAAAHHEANAKRDARIVEQRRRGLRLRDLAEREGCSPMTARRVLERLAPELLGRLSSRCIGGAT